MIYLKGKREKLESYNNEVKVGEKYKDSTQKWAEVIEIEGMFYIAFHENYPSELEKVEKLPEINNLAK